MPCDPPWPAPVVVVPEPPESSAGPCPALLPPAVAPALLWPPDEAPDDDPWEDPDEDPWEVEPPGEGIDTEPAEPCPLEPGEGMLEELLPPELPEEPLEPEAPPEDEGGEDVGDGADVDCWLAQPPIRNADTAPAAATRAATTIHRYSE